MAAERQQFHLKNSLHHLKYLGRAFTLVELLVVISIIGILAAMLLTAVSMAIVRAKIRKAQMEIAQIVNGINSYHSIYGSYPVSSNAVSIVNSVNPPDDFTYGGTALASVLGPGPWTANNSEVVAILMDLENYGDGTPTINKGHVKNPQQSKFLNATMVSDTTSPGVGTDGVYRDPWGDPYIISIDLNYDGKCRDAFYKKQSVSQQSGATGFNGLFNSQGDPNSDYFEFNGSVMVWSLGPDRAASAAPGVKANVAPNRDNVLSWKQ